MNNGSPQNLDKVMAKTHAKVEAFNKRLKDQKQALEIALKTEPDQKTREKARAMIRRIDRELESIEISEA
ncbi:MAG: hypothetical protein GY938_10235 [Ketobacter sp.]|nr:hypothetical protein [Ketobacter sp.]